LGQVLALARVLVPALVLASALVLELPSNSILRNPQNPNMASDPRLLPSRQGTCWAGQFLSKSTSANMCLG